MDKSLNEGVPDIENAWFIDPTDLKIQHEIGHGIEFKENWQIFTKNDILHHSIRSRL
jgi:hypothetical protein